jgi:colanic acid biosynthesis glycosyl transferase WcaI
MLQFALDKYALNPDICDVVYPFQSLSGVRSQKVPAVLIPHEKTLVYSGALGEKQAPEELLRLLDAFARRNRDYQAIVFSDGPIFESLKEQYRASGSPVEFHGLVPDDELEGLLRSSTIQVIPQKLSVSHGAFPSKLPNIIAADTAIFGVTDAGSEVDDILSQYSRGKAVNNWNLNESLDSLEAFAYKLASDTEVPGAENEDAELKSLFRVERLCEVINEVAKIRTKFSSERD